MQLLQQNKKAAKNIIKVFPVILAKLFPNLTTNILYRDFTLCSNNTNIASLQKLNQFKVSKTYVTLFKLIVHLMFDNFSEMQLTRIHFLFYLGRGLKKSHIHSKFVKTNQKLRPFES